jgi:hypothetical protein
VTVIQGWGRIALRATRIAAGEELARSSKNADVTEMLDPRKGALNWQH